MSIEVKEFYSKLQFPGHYTMEDILYYDEIVCNDYLKFYDESVSCCNTVLDVGCGSGFIVNFLAYRHKNIQFTAIDFGDGIDFAKNFSKNNNINNITYHKVDFLSWNTTDKYDLVFCNGVLHHIPNQTKAIQKLKSLSNQNLMLGVYNKYGKIAKKIFPIDASSNILYLDQEKCPFEVSYTDNQFRNMFNEYRVTSIYPNILGKFVNTRNLFNHRNGGLTVYLLTPKS